MGYWEQNEQKEWRCSECGNEPLYRFDGWYKQGFMDYSEEFSMVNSKYCPYCGAKMNYEKRYVSSPVKYTEEEKSDIVKGGEKDIETWFIADLHFYDKNIIKYEHRPFKSVEEMNKTFIKNWNAVVSKNDIAIVLGDISMGSLPETKRLIKGLNGKLMLVMGNHDKEKTTDYWRTVGFDEVTEYPIIYKDWFILSHEPPTYISKDTPYAYIYGHVHGTSMYPTATENTICVSAERWEYTPVNFKDLIQTMNDKANTLCN